MAHSSSLSLLFYHTFILLKQQTLPITWSSIIVHSIYCIYSLPLSYFCKNCTVAAASIFHLSVNSSLYHPMAHLLYYSSRMYHSFQLSLIQCIIAAVYPYWLDRGSNFPFTTLWPNRSFIVSSGSLCPSVYHKSSLYLSRYHAPPLYYALVGSWT